MKATGLGLQPAAALELAVHEHDCHRHTVRKDGSTVGTQHNVGLFCGPIPNTVISLCQETHYSLWRKTRAYLDVKYVPMTCVQVGQDIPRLQRDSGVLVLCPSIRRLLAHERSRIQLRWSTHNYPHLNLLLTSNLPQAASHALRTQCNPQDVLIRAYLPRGTSASRPGGDKGCVLPGLPCS